MGSCSASAHIIVGVPAEISSPKPSTITLPRFDRKTGEAKLSHDEVCTVMLSLRDIYGNTHKIFLEDTEPWKESEENRGSPMSLDGFLYWRARCLTAELLAEEPLKDDIFTEAIDATLAIMITVHGRADVCMIGRVIKTLPLAGNASWQYPKYVTGFTGVVDQVRRDVRRKLGIDIEPETYIMARVHY